MSWIGKRKREYREEQAAANAIVSANSTVFRQEASARVWDDKTTSTNTPSTAIPSLITIDPKDKYSYIQQDLVAREDPIARYITTRIAENIFDEGFYFVKEGTDERHPLDTEFQLEFKRMNGKNTFIKTFATMFKHGHVWLDVIPEDLPQDLRVDEYGNDVQPRIAKIDYYSPLYTEVLTWTATGIPLTLKVNYKMPDHTSASYDPIDTPDCIFLRNGDMGDRSYRGVSVLVGIWDALTYIRQVLFAMGWYAIKTGIGVFYVKIRGSVTKEKKAAAQAMLEGVSTKRGIIYSDLVIDELGFIQADGSSINFPDYVDALLAQVAIDSGIPKSILAGLDSGAGSSEVNADLRVGVINTYQKRYEYAIRELCHRMHLDFDDADIVWPTRYATSEEQESKIYMNNTQADAVAINSYMTINEVRALRGLPSVTGGEELIALRDPNAMSLDIASQDERDQTNNPEGNQV